MNIEIDRKIDVTAILFLLVQSRQQTHDRTLIESGANGLGIQECTVVKRTRNSLNEGLLEIMFKVPINDKSNFVAKI